MSTAAPTASPTSARERRILLVVWLAMTIAAAAFVLTVGSNLPAAGEWEAVPVLVGKESLGPWLWERDNGVRLPLSRLLYAVEFRLTHDFRAAMLVQVAILSALGLGLMRLAASLRGRPDWPDLFLPLSLLHLGHWENLLLGIQLQFALFLVFACGLVRIALRVTQETAFRYGLAAGLLLVLAALTGRPGLVLVLPVTVWILVLAVIVKRTEGPGRSAIVAAPVFAAVVYLAVSVAGLPANGNLADVAVWAAQALALAPGVGVARIWPAAALAVVLLLVATAVLVTRKENRLAAGGLLAIAIGIIAVAAAAGSEVGSGLHARFSYLTWPLLAAAYLSWVKAGKVLVPYVLCVVTALALVPNNFAGVASAAPIFSADSGFESAIAAGVPEDELVRKSFPHTRNAGHEESAIGAIPMLREARVGSFAPEGQSRSALWLLAIEIVLAALGGRWLWIVARAVQAERARELFRLQHERYEELLVKAGAATGLPRGLRWVSCVISGDAVLVRDETNGSILALVPVVLQFEPEEGSDMESVPAAREPRPATAVFTFVRGTWQTTGKVVFNHTPEQTVARFAPQFRVIDHGHH